MGFLLDRLLLLPGILIGLAIHEFSHGLAADRLGDPTPRNQGRLTIEPWPHIDLFGFIMLMLIGFGWAKPVQIDNRYFKKPKRDEIIVSVAGPIANLLLAFLFALMIFCFAKFHAVQHFSTSIQIYFWNILYKAVWINVVLFVFNLLPIPPLDGSHIIANLLPPDKAAKFMAFGMYSMIILLVIMLSDTASSLIVLPMRIIYSIVLMVFGIPDILNYI